MPRSTSHAINHELRKKVTESMLYHELHRFSTMEDDALVKRVNKIRSPLKLEACRQMAKIAGNIKVLRLARKRRNELCLKSGKCLN